MKHIWYIMTGTDPAPAGDGDSASWFKFYKWNTDEETYVPVRYPFLDAREGDFLWFVMDGRVLGGAPVLRVETPPTPQQRQEIWFNAAQIREIPKESDLSIPATYGKNVPDSFGDSMLALSVPRKKD